MTYPPDVKGIIFQSVFDDFPRRITAIRPSTKEEVVIGFNKYGKAKWLLYKKPDDSIKMTYNDERKKYVALPNPPKIKMAWTLRENKWKPISLMKNKSCPNQNFFTFRTPLHGGYILDFGKGLFEINMTSSYGLGHMDDDYLFFQGHVEVVRAYNTPEEARIKKRMLSDVKKITPYLNLSRNTSSQGL